MKWGDFVITGLCDIGRRRFANSGEDQVAETKVSIDDDLRLLVGGNAVARFSSTEALNFAEQITRTAFRSMMMDEAMIFESRQAPPRASRKGAR